MVPEPPRSPVLRPAAGVAALCLLLALLFACRAWLLRTSDETLYEVQDDYAALALGHGVNLDHWKEMFPGPRTLGYFQINHPGHPAPGGERASLPALAHEPGATAQERARRTLANPARFLEADRVAVLVLFMASSLCTLRRDVEGGRHSCDHPRSAWLLSPTPRPGRTSSSWSGTRPSRFPSSWLSGSPCGWPSTLPLRPWAFLLVGGVAGVAYLNKMNYVAWLLASALGLVWFVSRVGVAPSGRRWRRWRPSSSAWWSRWWDWALRSSARMASGGCLLEHGRVFLNTGHYGEGDPGVVDLGVAWANVQSGAGP